MMLKSFFEFLGLHRLHAGNALALALDSIKAVLPQCV